MVAVNIDALYDNQSHRIGAINVFQDVTEQKKSEKNLENVNRQLKELTQDLEQRVRERTHQLEEQSEQLRRLALELTEAEERERKRLAEILHDHLQQLLIAAKMRLTWSRGAITEKAVEEAQSFLEQAYEASRSLTAELRPPVLYEGGLNASLRFLTRKFQDQYGFKVTLSFNTNAEPFSNDAKTMIYQSVQELLINAVKYSGVKECSLAVERLPKGNLRVLVEDQGVGFDVKNIGKKGSEGFGLFSIRERVKALGGDCQISSQAGRGTSFEIRIPDPAPAGEDHFAEIAEDDSAAFPAHKREEALRVLLADDHKIVRQSLAQLLGSQPFIHQVLEAEDGKDAVEKARAFQPDVVIMDLNMPKMNGIEATKMLHETHPQIKIIGLSVQIEPETAQAMKDAGAVAYFSKSQDINSLIDALQAFAAAKTAAVIPLS